MTDNLRFDVRCGTEPLWVKADDEGWLVLNDIWEAIVRVQEDQKDAFIAGLIELRRQERSGDEKQGS